MSQSVTVDGVSLRLSHPVELEIEWVGREELRLQLLAAWMVVEKRDIPLNPRLVGKPGVGKTTLAYGAARLLGKEVYLFQATMDTRPEDLLVTPIVGEDQNIRYVASSLVTAMLRGGVCILDEGNRMSEKSWASLAPLLDNRRYVESVIAGIKVHAHPDFRFVATMNDDASTFDLPEYIHSRLQPQIYIDFPDKDEEEAIIRQNLPFCDEQVMDYVTGFLQRSHAANERYTVRDGINIARYALKLKKMNASTKKKGGPREVSSELKRAVQLILGEEALAYVPGGGLGPSGRPLGRIRVLDDDDE
jgi:MoxR-like ATPase